MSIPTPIKYRAFLSYSHRDAGWAKWLHSALENYRVDKDLVGRPTDWGPVPRSLRPIFRDRDDFSAGHSLTQQTLAALEASEFLVVFCSPNAARSSYVNEEIRQYKMMDRGNRVIPIIVDGEPGNDQRECFPPALRFKLRSDGSLSDEPEEPVAADARPEGDGKEIAKQKVIAGLLGLRLDEIMRRAEVARRRRSRFWAGLAAVLLLLAVISAGSAVLAYQKLIESNERLDQAIEIAYGFVVKATSMSERFGVPADITLELLGGADAALTHLIEKGADTTKLRYRKALMLLSFSDAYRTLGNLNDAIQKAAEAKSLLHGLTKRDPNNVFWQRDLALADFEIGEVLYAQGSLADALESYRRSLATLQPSAAEDTSDARWSRLTLSYNRVGQMLEYLGRRDEALAGYRDGITVVKRLVDANPDNVRLQRNLAFLYDHVGNVLHAQGRDAAALENLRAALAIMEPVAASDSTNTTWQRDLAAMHSFYLSPVLETAGLRDEALEHARTGAAIYERLSATDPKNVVWQEEGIRASIALVRVQVAKGLLDDALRTSQSAISAAKGLIGVDPHNARWQFDGGMAHVAIGDAQVALGQTEEALANYRRGLAMMGPVVTTNAQVFAEFSRGLLWAHNKTGDLLATKGAETEALKDYRAALALGERLTGSDPENEVWRRDLLWTQWRLAMHGDEPSSRLAFIVASLQKLKETGVISSDMSRLLNLANAKLGTTMNQ